MNPEAATPAGNPKYKCRDHGLEGCTSTVQQNRLDPLVLQWLRHLTRTPEAMAESRAAAIEWSDQRWKAARAQGRHLAASGPHATPSAYDALLQLEFEAALIDPVRLAQALAEDWDLLDNTQRRARLRSLVQAFVADNTYVTPVLGIHTAWAPRCASLAARHSSVASSASCHTNRNTPPNQPHPGNSCSPFRKPQI
jgi:hypothetical protein